MRSKPTVSILIATFNRANELSETFEVLAATTSEVLVRFELVIVDNNSCDNTRSIVERFQHRLPVRYLFESRPGKNCALNKALREVELGEIVVFTDDDISPKPGWLQEIVRSCREHPECAVFGGQIIPRWLGGSMPTWASDEFIQRFAFARHDLGSSPVIYPDGILPFGGNFWVRRQVIERGFSYDERVGPRPKRRIMGSESRFLADLAAAGYKMMYWPFAAVDHRIQRSECSVWAIQRRAIRLGRGEIYMAGLPRPELQAKHPVQWRLYLYVKVLYASVLWVASFFSLSAPKRLKRSVDALRVMGNSLESLQSNDV